MSYPNPALESIARRAATLLRAAFVLGSLTPALHAQIVVSLNKPATASAEYYPAANAVDGNFGTHWNAGGYAGWLIVDLGSVYSLHQITLVGYANLGPDSGRTNDYSLYRSDDASTWNFVGAGTFVENTHPSDRWDLAGASGRYIKYETVASSTNWGALIEMSVTAIPEPSAFAAGAGLVAFGVAAARKRRGWPGKRDRTF